MDKLQVHHTVTGVSPSVDHLSSLFHGQVHPTVTGVSPSVDHLSCLFHGQVHPTVTGVSPSVDHLRGTVYLQHCDQLMSLLRLLEHS